MLLDNPTGFAARHLNHISTLLHNGYGHTSGLVVVSADPKYFRSWAKNVTITDQYQRSDLKYILRLADGIYRTIYLNTHVKKKIPMAGKIIVAVVQRLDGCPIPEDDLFTFGISKNALSSQTKNKSAAHNIMISNTVLRTIDMKMNVSIRMQYIIWLQKRIQQIRNKTYTTNAN